MIEPPPRQEVGSFGRSNTSEEIPQMKWDAKATWLGGLGHRDEKIRTPRRRGLPSMAQGYPSQRQSQTVKPGQVYYNPTFSSLCPHWSGDKASILGRKCSLALGVAQLQGRQWLPTSLQDSTTHNSPRTQMLTQYLCVLNFQVHFHFVYIHHPKNILKQKYPFDI